LPRQELKPAAAEEAGAIERFAPFANCRGRPSPQGQ